MIGDTTSPRLIVFGCQDKISTQEIDLRALNTVETIILRKTAWLTWSNAFTESI